MRLDEFIEFEANERAERRRLAAEKDYGILDRLDSFERRFEEHVSDDAVVGSVSPSIFVGRSDYPNVSTGLLSPVGREERAAAFETSASWYDEGVSHLAVRRRTSLLNSARGVDVRDAVRRRQRGGRLRLRHRARRGREPSTTRGTAGSASAGGRHPADRPVRVEIGLDGAPDLTSTSVTRHQDATGPARPPRTAELGENPHVPRPIQRPWRRRLAARAMTYL
ncbi:hypothetical protein [Halorubrum sp. Ib24]|uniref:hypothetical protein n=1 Tax=Halorubrum sp. Ib24 TaxID=1383850 RepID=UPI000B986AF7|nr:hypothetical protein [Halorubrum sp. Ib24]